METNELLIRTLNAAKAARDRGFFKTADAFDEIAEDLLQFLTSPPRSPGEERAKTAPDLLHFH